MITRLLSELKASYSPDTYKDIEVMHHSWLKYKELRFKVGRNILGKDSGTVGIIESSCRAVVAIKYQALFLRSLVRRHESSMIQAILENHWKLRNPHDHLPAFLIAIKSNKHMERNELPALSSVLRFVYRLDHNHFEYWANLGSGIIIWLGVYFLKFLSTSCLSLRYLAPLLLIRLPSKRVHWPMQVQVEHWLR